jgi:hypothetical protein
MSIPFNVKSLSGARRVLTAGKIFPLYGKAILEVEEGAIRAGQVGVRIEQLEEYS